MLLATGGMGFFYACHFGMVVLLAKFAPPEVLGQVQFALAVATPVVMFCSLELRSVLVADVHGEFAFGTYRRLRDVALWLAGIVLLGFVAWQSVHERQPAFLLILAAMSAGRIVLSLADLNWGVFQKRNRLDLLARSAIWRGLGLLGPFALLLPLLAWLARGGHLRPERIADGAALACWLYVLASVLVLLFFDRRHVRSVADLAWGWSRPAVLRLAWQTLPLGFVLLLLQLSQSLPQWGIQAQPGGRAALGHFSALLNITLAGNLLLFQAVNAAANRLAHAYQSDLKAFLRLTARLLGLAGGVGLVMLAVAVGLGGWLLRVLYRAEYAGDEHELQIVIVAQALALLTNVFGVLVLQMRLFWAQVPAQLVVLGVTAAATLALIPGAPDLVRGGAWVLLIRSGVHAAAYAGCVLLGIILRPRLLQQRPAAPVPAPSAGPESLEEW